jgi:ribosomal protein S18 acetylase RimI-like enzyme
MIRYLDKAKGITPDQLKGFFEGWPNPPSPETHLQLLQQSYAVVLALDAPESSTPDGTASGDIVGFITAISDGVLAAYIPLLEVRPSYRGQGIGKTLMRRMLDRLDDLYMVDLLCNPGLQAFYTALGMHPASGMMLRHYEYQSGRHYAQQDNEKNPDIHPTDGGL